MRKASWGSMRLSFGLQELRYSLNDFADVDLDFEAGVPASDVADSVVERFFLQED